MSRDSKASISIAPIDRDEVGTLTPTSERWNNPATVWRIALTHRDIHPRAQAGCPRCPVVVCPECGRIDCPDVSVHRAREAGAETAWRLVA